MSRPFICKLHDTYNINTVTTMSFAVTRRLWDNGSTLTIAFVSDPSDTLRRAIISAASQWLPHINLTFDFVEGHEGDIRIATNTLGIHKSVLGNYALQIDPSEPTMTIGEDENQPSFNATVLHEFGHALAAAHEHLHPDSDIPWDKPKVYAYYRTHGLTDEETDRMVLNKRPHSSVTYTPYDPKSIMHYSVLNELTLGDFEIAENTEISQQDIALMKLLYPKNVTETQ